MKRANETAQIILTSLPDIPVSDCCLLEEGAPIPPEPPVGSWKPEPYVRQTFFFMLSDLSTMYCWKTYKIRVQFFFENLIMRHIHLKRKMN
jgi:hypothetical protein